MFSKKPVLALFAAVVVLSMLAAACAAPAAPQTIVETVVVEVEGETIIETVVVEKEVEKIVEKEVIVEVGALPEAEFLFLTGRTLQDRHARSHVASLAPHGEDGHLVVVPVHAECKRNAALTGCPGQDPREEGPIAIPVLPGPGALACGLAHERRHAAQAESPRGEYRVGIACRLQQHLCPRARACLHVTADNGKAHPAGCC